MNYSAYTQISHKTYYKPEDVMAIVAVVEDRKKDMRFREIWERKSEHEIICTSSITLSVRSMLPYFSCFLFVVLPAVLRIGVFLRIRFSITFSSSASV